MNAPVTPPATVADFKTQFFRGFKFTDGPDGVMDKDIALGLTMATSLYNPAIWAEAEGKVAFLFAAAHFVVVNIQAAGGLSARAPGAPGSDAGDATRNTGGGIITNKTVEKVSVAYAGMEKWVEKYPLLAGFLRTDFGFQYLDLLKARLVGRVVSVPNQRMVDAAVPVVPFLA
jgi:hypothetical protein